jgi:hypothetical protein
MTTVNEPLAITHNIYQSLDSGKDVSVIFPVVSEAFDKVFHEGLLFIRRQFDIAPL